MVVRIGPKNPPRRALFLREWRLHRGLSQEQLAERLDTTKATISRVETGARDWTGGFVEAAAEALNIEVRDFFYPPTQPSIDARLQAVPEPLREQVRAVVDTMLKTGTR
jgi:transcriptional regulator with XRE-family HTH domain